MLKLNDKEIKYMKMKVINSYIQQCFLFPDEYNSILIRTEINVPEIPKMNADNK